MGHAQHSMVRAKPRAAQEAEGALRRGGEVRQQCCGATSVPGTPGKEKHPRQWEQPGQRCRSRNAHGVSGGTTSCSMGEVALLLLEGALALLLDRSPAPGFAPSRRLSDQLHSFPSKLCRCELAAKWGPRENPEGEHSSHKAGPWGPPAAGVICPGVWGRQVALGSGWDQCGLLSQERLPQALEIRPMAASSCSHHSFSKTASVFMAEQGQHLQSWHPVAPRPALMADMTYRWWDPQPRIRQLILRGDRGLGPHLKAMDTQLWHEAHQGLTLLLGL